MTSDYDHRQFGYGRELAIKDQQRGFVLHDRHIFLCYGNRLSWPADFELGRPDSLSARLISAFNSCEDQIKTKTILTICEPSGDVLLKEGDVLIFPDMIKYSLTPSGVDSFIKEVLVNDGIWSMSPMKPLREGSYVFVCAHGAHDRRSGVCGELVLQKLNELVEINKLGEKLFPIPCSDIGVPEFAANLIIFSRDANQQVDGHWYSYLCPKVIPCIIYSHIVQGFVLHRRWRGKLGNKKILALREYPTSWWSRAGINDFLCTDFFRKGDLMVGWDSLKEDLEPGRAIKQYMEDLIACKLIVLEPIVGIVEGAKPWLELKGEPNVCASEMQWEQNVERPSREEPERASEMQREQKIRKRSE